MTSDDWCTPRWLAVAVGVFDVDPCSNSRSHVTAGRTFALELGQDGLAEPWYGSVWLNPPYSNVMPWAERLAEHDGPWCALIKLDPTTKWWSRLLDEATGWAPFRKRIAFERPDAGSMVANFASALVWSCWRPRADLRLHLWPSLPGGAA